MDDIKYNISRKILELNYRLRQISYSKKEIRFYYVEKAIAIKEEIKDLESQLIYYNNCNNSNIIDLHGATKYFVDYYLDDLIYEKFLKNDLIKVITGRGTMVMFNYVKKYLNTNEIKFKSEDYYFILKKN